MSVIGLKRYIIHDLLLVICAAFLGKSYYRFHISVLFSHISIMTLHFLPVFNILCFELGLCVASFRTVLCMTLWILLRMPCDTIIKKLLCRVSMSCNNIAYIK